jgi:hypothetical protein
MMAGAQIMLTHGMADGKFGYQLMILSIVIMAIERALS